MNNEQFIFAEINLILISRYNLISQEVHQYPSMRRAIITEMSLRVVESNKDSGGRFQECFSNGVAFYQALPSFPFDMRS